MYLKLIINNGKRGRKPTKLINLGNRYNQFLFKYKNKKSIKYEFLYINKLEKLRLISSGIKSYSKFN